MLRVKPPWSASVRLLDERDRGAVLAICDRDPVTNVFVSSRIRSLNRSTAFGAIRRFGVPALVKLNPRNFLAQGRATALFCWFT